MTHVKEKFSCIILAGGEGKRVDGRDKGLINYKNKPLTQHVIDAVEPQTHEIIISANRNLEKYKELGYKVISDSVNGFKGPLSGMAATLPYCSNDHVLVVPCDMPHLPQDIIERLTFNTLTNTINVVAINNKLQIVFLLHKKILPSVTLSLEKNERRLMQWVKSQQPEVVNFQDADAFLNYNTSADLN